MSRKNTVSDEGDPRKYFAMIPHLIDDSGLDPYAYRLYGHLIRLARQGNEVEQTTRELATHCCMSVGKVSAAKIALAEKNLIAIESDGYRDKIVIKDVWRENMLRYANISAEPSPPSIQPATSETCSPHEQVLPPNGAGSPLGAEQTCSPHEQVSQTRSPDEQDSETCSPHEQTCSPHEQVELEKSDKNVIEQKLNKKKGKKDIPRAEASGAGDSFIHSDSVNAADFERNFELLTDPEVDMDKPGARRLAAEYSFDLLVRQVFAWISHKKKNKDYDTIGALIHRIEEDFGARKLTAKDMETDLYRRHHPEPQSNKYCPPGYEHLIRGYSHIAPTTEGANTP